MNRKGIELPISMIVVAVVAILILVVGSFFFLGSSLGQMNQAQATGIWNEGCNRYCKYDAWDGSYQIGPAAEIGEQDEFSEKFAKACVVLGYITEEQRSKGLTHLCLKHCPHCEFSNISVSSGENSIINQLQYR
jgi:hypothetical protein